jgi:hypothetical protein
LRGVVDWDQVEQVPGDLLGAVGDGQDRRAADQLGQAADHAAGAAEQVLAQPGQRAGLVVVQAQAGLHGGGQAAPGVALPGGAVVKRPGRDEGEPAGDLPAPGPGEQADLIHVQAGVDERRRQLLCEIFERVGHLGAGPGGQADVVDLTSTRSTFVREAVAQTALVTSVRLARAGAGSPKNRANSIATIRGAAAGGTVM